MIALDTNVLVRYVVQDDKAQAARATRLIEDECSEDTPAFITTIVLVELLWVLESCYSSTRSQLANIVEQVLRTRQFLVQDADIVWQAVRRFKAGKADFSDCLIDAVARASGCELTVTFDKTAAAAGMKMLT